MTDSSEKRRLHLLVRPLLFGDYADSVCRSQTVCSTPIEDPNVVLIMIGAAHLFSRSKALPRIDQFVSKRDVHFTVRPLGFET
jgi:hypothetical protein